MSDYKFSLPNNLSSAFITSICMIKYCVGMSVNVYIIDITVLCSSVCSVLLLEGRTKVQTVFYCYFLYFPISINFLYFHKFWWDRAFDRWNHRFQPKSEYFLYFLLDWSGQVTSHPFGDLGKYPDNLFYHGHGPRCMDNLSSDSTLIMLSKL